jgi:hypothetical protein
MIFQRISLGQYFFYYYTNKQYEKKRKKKIAYPVAKAIKLQLRPSSASFINLQQSDFHEIWYVYRVIVAVASSCKAIAHISLPLLRLFLLFICSFGIKMQYSSN